MAITREAVWNAILENLRQMMLEQDQELGEVAPATMINADLGVPSIDVIHLMVSLEDRFQRQLDFDQLATTPEGTFRDDISLGDLHEFVCRKISADPAPLSAQAAG